MNFSFIQLIKHSTPHLVALVLIVVCLQLAQWQRDRADEKATLIDQWNQSVTLTPDQPLAFATAPLFSKVTLQGQFDPTRHVLLDNQTRNNHPGVHVFVPFYPIDNDQIILINRGWQPWLRHSGEWPEYVTPEGLVTIQGRLSNPPRVGFELGQAQALKTDDWPNLMTYFDVARIKEALGPNLSNRVLLLDPEDAHHLSKDPWPSVNMTPDRHMAYAFQWLAIAVAILIIWLSLSYRFYWKKPSE